MDRRIVGLGCLVILAAGCGDRSEITYVEWLRQPRVSDVSGGRFELYAKAAAAVESAAAKYLRTVNFTPGKRDLCMKQIAPALAMVAQAGTRPELGYRFKARKPFEEPEFLAAWRLVGRGFVWKIEAAIKTGDLDAAIQTTAIATRFGLDLIGGSAMEASLGLAIVDDARRAVTPSLAKMEPKQLEKLREGIMRAMRGAPELQQTIENEQLNMLAGVQLLQDAFRAEEWKRLIDMMGPDVRTAVDKLKELRHEDPTDRVAFFKGLADEAREEADYVARIAALPTVERGSVPQPILNSSRPWRRFSVHFMGTLRPLLKQYDATLARTKLLALETHLQTIARTRAPYPKTLAAFGDDITVDPYTGQAFPYRADGGDCKVYSVGEDLTDDGGQTDDAFNAPDLRLESR